MGGIISFRVPEVKVSVIFFIDDVGGLVVGILAMLGGHVALPNECPVRKMRLQNIWFFDKESQVYACIHKTRTFEHYSNGEFG